MPHALSRVPVALSTDSFPASRRINGAVRLAEQRCLAPAEHTEMDFFTDDYAAAETAPSPRFADCDVFLPRTGSDEALSVRIPFVIPLAPPPAARSPLCPPREDRNREREDEEEEEGAAAAAAAPSDSTDLSDAARPPAALCAARVEKRAPPDSRAAGRTNTERIRYALRLPRGFARALRLPRALADALRSAAAAATAPPLWLSAFAQPQRPGGGGDAVAEAVAAAALELVARMGAMRRGGEAFASGGGGGGSGENGESYASRAVATAQRALLWSEESIFGIGEADRVTQRLRRGAFLLAPESSSWPSLAAVVFHFAQEIARSLFPALSAEVEAAILSALQPLLEVDSSTSVHSQSSLSTEPAQRDALLLLSQGLAQWWWWWRPFKAENDNKFSNATHVGSNDAMLCALPLSAPMSYAAVRALQQFAIAPASLDHSAEDGETAFFLLAAPSLFSALLLDRDVTGVLDRAVKTMQSMNPAALSSSFSPQLVRCITVLLCWVAFRPAGYESSLVRAYFGTLLRLAAHGAAERADDDGQMAQCGRQCCMRTGAMFRRLRAQCGKSGDADARRVNPWRQMRSGGGAHIPNSRDEDECTAQSYRSLLDGGEGAEYAHDGIHTIAAALPLPFPLSPNGVPEALRALRHAVREVRVALRRLERDAFGEAGVKRCRDGERALRPAGISPQLAYHIYARPESARWEWHMYEDEEEEGDTTTSSNRSVSSGE